MGLALVDFLQDFGARPALVLRPEPVDPEPFRASIPQPDIGAIVAAAVEQAESMLAEKLRAEHAEAMETERQAHAAEIDALLHRFGETAGEQIAAGLAVAEARVGDLATAAAARMLGSVLSDELQARSIASRAQSIREAVQDAETVRIEIRGPQSLFESLRTKLPDRVDGLHFVEAPGFDLTVRIDGNLFETRLAEWSAVLSDILS